MTTFRIVIVCGYIISATAVFAHDYGLRLDPQNSDKSQTKRVCVIGAGIAGLSAARYLKEEGINFTVLETTRYVGGTWRYDPRVGTDENGMHLHTSMYEHLRTNLPTPAMELRGFPLPDGIPSFPSGKIYYSYLNAFARHFEILKDIQFLHNVVSVRREADEVWKVRHVHVKTNETFEEEYDFIIVANGHFSKPHRPKFSGEDIFKGTIIHSHDYKKPDHYKDRRVLVIGAGPSGMEIGLIVADVSKTLVHSHHSPVNFRTPFPSNYIRKLDVERFNETGAIFVDGSYEDLDDVILCTGFEYDFPFLDETCGLNITSHMVTPLYKYMVNINQPSMVVMGLISRACLPIALDAQARYATALVKGNFTLPTHEEMMQDWQKHVDIVRSKGFKMSLIHVLAEKEDDYYAALSQESGIDRVPQVMFKIRKIDIEAKLENLYTYRNYVYKVIDDQTFIRSLEEPPMRNSLAP